MSEQCCAVLNVSKSPSLRLAPTSHTDKDSPAQKRCNWPSTFARRQSGVKASYSKWGEEFHQKKKANQQPQNAPNNQIALEPTKIAPEAATNPPQNVLREEPANDQIATAAAATLLQSVPREEPNAPREEPVGEQGTLREDTASDQITPEAATTPPQNVPHRDTGDDNVIAPEAAVTPPQGAHEGAASDQVAPETSITNAKEGLKRAASEEAFSERQKRIALETTITEAKEEGKRAASEETLSERQNEATEKAV